MKPINREIHPKPLKKNPLKNLGALLKLNPHAKTARRMTLLAEEQRAKAKQEKLDKKRKEPKVCGWILLTLLRPDREKLTSLIKYFVKF